MYARAVDLFPFTYIVDTNTRVRIVQLYSVAYLCVHNGVVVVETFKWKKHTCQLLVCLLDIHLHVHLCTSLHWGMASKPGGSGVPLVVYRANDVCLFLSSIHSMYMYIGMSVVISCAKHSANIETLSACFKFS